MICIFWGRFLSLTRSTLRLCSATHRPGYWSNPALWLAEHSLSLLRARDRKQALVVLLTCRSVAMLANWLARSTFCTLKSFSSIWKRNEIKLKTVTAPLHAHDSCNMQQHILATYTTGMWYTSFWIIIGPLLHIQGLLVHQQWNYCSLEIVHQYGISTLK